jgi:GT2 family glycosyltransferase
VTDPEAIDVSIIIPHFLGDILSDCLASIYENTKGPSFEVIVADDQPHDDGSIGRALERWPDIRIVKTGGGNGLPTKGLAFGCNRGLEIARGRYAMLLNNDVEVSEGWLQALVDVADADPEIGAAQPKVRSMREKQRLDSEGAAGGLMDVYAYPFCLGRVFDTVEEDEGQYDRARDIFWALGGAMFLRMDALKTTGLLDEAFYMHMEEIDLCWRLHLSGYRIVSVPSSVIYHWGGFSLTAESFLRLYLKHRNSLVMMIKNVSVGSLVTRLPIRLLIEFLTAGALLKGDWKRAVAAWAGVLWVLAHPVNVLRRRTIAQKTRTVTDQAVDERMYRGSVVWAYYLRGKTRASDLVEEVKGLQEGGEQGAGGDF